MCFIPVADRVTGELKLSAISETVNRPNAPSAGPPHHRYNRAFFKGDTIVDDANVFGRGIDHLIPHG